MWLFKKQDLHGHSEIRNVLVFANQSSAQPFYQEQAAGAPEFYLISQQMLIYMINIIINQHIM